MSAARRLARRAGARGTQWLATHGAQILAIGLALVLGWSALAQLRGAPNTALELASRVLSIVSVGHLTPAHNRWILAVWDGALALTLLWPRAARLAQWLAWPRLVLALLPLAMIRDDLGVAGEQLCLVYALLLLSSAVVGATRRWRVLQGEPGLAELVAAPPISPQQRARRRRRAAAALVVLALAGAAGSAAWPSYLRWFHARQEAGALDEKLSGRLIKKSMPLSPLLGRKITTWVYLPPGYDRIKMRYPVIYAMHGMPGEVRDVFVKGQLQDAAEQLILSRKIKPVIIVGWDGEGPNGPADITEFLDRKDGSWPMESFIVKELVPYIDRTYRTIARPQARALVGVSAGGYAAVNLLFKHPDVWKIGASHTGFFDPADDADNMTDILGAPGPLWNQNNPMKTVSRVTPAQDLHVYADIGAGDELSAEFTRFCALLQKQKIDHACHVFPGRHTWEYWSAHFYDSLQFIDARFAQMKVGP